MKKALFIMISLWSIFLLMGCNSEEESKEEGQDIREMVQDYSTGSFDNVSASITSHKLIVKDDKEKSYDLPAEEFFVSIAPYVKETHPCEIHSLTGCQGELVNKDFNVYIQDEDGKVIVDETMTSLENGFIDIWLPREKTYQVRINYGEKTSETTISTFKDDNTCITTMQLI
ncbi:CueP family metal-binding protein [Bacillus sp. E214]|uniref:CueP family metal-binding protein n=1 Tax=Bacillus sp. E214 TaxID=2587156 RepID=UPI0011E04B39|nr:CueP family metal-binding protein [Bacillus sp. E214]